ncbi:hypothetical protein F5J12DRAFT_782333 [Pisolithus orientalis]|uniref:uncharacterized protein n=1 Tax=Pisolithus orientalis TaxID=936130 RepID=UPI0022259114|nr:uncharacterized protein F5J12DRAFT_782333 [Pisolithus orientalis]KAI6008931.1 hypothetical protein F5J12DRAFT_782333 [Pisolithus orientalis]
MCFLLFASGEESYPLTPLNRNCDPSGESIDDLWSVMDTEETESTDTHKTMVITSGTVMDTKPTINICSSTAIMSVGEEVDPVPMDTAVVRAAGSSLGTCPVTDLVYLDTPSFHHFMCEQAKECNELMKTFEETCLTIEKKYNLTLAEVQQELEDKTRSLSAYKEHVGKELHVCDTTIQEQWTLLESLDQNVRMLQTALDHEFTRLDVEIRQLSTVVKEEPHASMSVGTERLSGTLLREATVGSVAEEVVQMLRSGTAEPLYSTPSPHHKVNSRKHCQSTTVKQEILNDQESNDNLAITRDEDFLAYELPPHEVVMDFTEGNSPGPNLPNLQWDFSSPVSSVWNQTIIGIFLNELHAKPNWLERNPSIASDEEFQWMQVIIHGV